MKIRSAEMRHGPEGRDPALSRDVEHWQVSTETKPPYTQRSLAEVSVSVTCSSLKAAQAFERQVHALLHPGEG